LKREEKVKLVEQLRDFFDRANMVILFDFKGVTVAEANQLRRALEKHGDVELRIVKNTLARLAVKELGAEILSEHFVGPNAILFAYGDLVPPTKTLVDFARQVNAVDIKVAMLNEKIISAVEVKALAALPGREQLLAQALATMQAPVSGFVNLLAQVPRGMLNVLAALKDEKEKEAA